MQVGGGEQGRANPVSRHEICLKQLFSCGYVRLFSDFCPRQFEGHPLEV